MRKICCRFVRLVNLPVNRIKIYITDDIACFADVANTDSFGKPNVFYGLRLTEKKKYVSFEWFKFDFVFE